MTNEELWSRVKRGLSNLTPCPLLRFEVHIVEHCNLNCVCCNNFSPLAEECYLDPESYEKDCKRLSELFDGEMASILLLGGEPLLHPQITEFMRITRSAFPVGLIRIVTNGILFPSMSEEFWEACRKYEVEISPTCYPIKVDHDGWGEIIEDKGITYSPFSSARDTMAKMPLSIKYGEARNEGKDSFLECGGANHCITLRDGRMYPCPAAAHAMHLKKYFDLDIPLSPQNSVDIYSVASGTELMEKLARPIPFCRYCDITDKEIELPWRVSRKDRYEWLAFEFFKEDIAYLKEKKPVVYVFGAGVWGKRAVALLKDDGIEIKAVLVTRNAHGTDHVLGVPIVLLDDLGEVETNSICLVALRFPDAKSEVYPILSKIPFGDVVPVTGLE